MTTPTRHHAYVAATSPYPWPFDGNLDPRATAVLVVQRADADWSRVDGEVVQAARMVAGGVSGSGGTVIHVVTAPPRSRQDVMSQPHEWGVVPDSVVTSAGIDGFFGSSLDALLRAKAVSRLVLVGIGLETCVHSTMRSANDRGYECLLVSDACHADAPGVFLASLSMIEMSGGIFGAVGTAAAVAAAYQAGSSL